MLLPPDLRDWVSDDDLAHFILEAVEGVDLSQARVNMRGSGSKQYPPGMMLGVLIYCYATGVFSSRRIEQMTYRHLSVRYLAANEHPDHDTICTFRRENGPLIKAAFTQVLKLAAALNLAKVGSVCIDGTKILANAAKRRTFNEEELLTREKQLQSQIDALLEEAEEADQSTTEKDGTQLPGELKGREQLKQQIRRAREQLAEQVQERAKEREHARKDWEKERIGDRPRRLSSKPGNSDRINLSDPQSALMPMAKGGYEQGYNAQLGVSAELNAVIVAAEVNAQTNDRSQLLPMAKAVAAQIPEFFQQAVVDTGYDNSRHIFEVEGTLGVEVICSPQRSPSQKNQKRSGGRCAIHRKNLQRLRAKQRAKAESDEGKSWLRLRRMTVEPVFGLIKSVLGFRRFSLRGLEKVDLEWKLVAAAFNCRKLCHMRAKKQSAGA